MDLSCFRVTLGLAGAEEVTQISTEAPGLARSPHEKPVSQANKR